MEEDVFAAICFSGQFGRNATENRGGEDSGDGVASVITMRGRSCGLELSSPELDSSEELEDELREGTVEGIVDREERDEDTEPAGATCLWGRELAGAEGFAPRVRRGTDRTGMRDVEDEDSADVFNFADMRRDRRGSDPEETSEEEALERER